MFWLFYPLLIFILPNTPHTLLFVFFLSPPAANRAKCPWFTPTPPLPKKKNTDEEWDMQKYSAKEKVSFGLLDAWPQQRRLSVPFRPHTTAAVSLQRPASHRGPRYTHLPVDLTLTPAMPPAPIPHTLKLLEQERVNLHSRCSRVERGPKMTRMDGGVLPYINSIHVKEILKLLWVRTEQLQDGHRGTCSNNQQSHQKITHHVYRHW